MKKTVYSSHYLSCEETFLMETIEQVMFDEKFWNHDELIDCKNRIDEEFEKDDLDYRYIRSTIDSMCRLINSEYTEGETIIELYDPNIEDYRTITRLDSSVLETEVI